MTSPYNLKNHEENSDSFYKVLRDIAQETYRRCSLTLSTTTKEFSLFLKEKGISPRTSGEYYLELLTIAMVWREYLGGSQKTPKIITSVLTKLYAFRSSHPRLKNVVDLVRGFLSGIFVYPNSKSKVNNSYLNMENFNRLCHWLEATGEFADEVHRFTLWQQFFTNTHESQFCTVMDMAITQFDLFKKSAEEKLGPYTKNVPSFTKNLPSDEKWREDALFRQKSSVVYHINMVASEILNYSFHEEFLKTPHKVVLAPACMSTNHGRSCKKREEGGYIVCNNCTESCNLNRLSQLGKEHNFTLAIVPHSSTFTKWLKRWENSTEVGLIALACPLNIVVGGYQMRDLNIPSQCVLLDYSGCAKHWGPDEQSTAVNEKRLLKVLKEGA